jgi:hypothetical protein
MITSLLMAVFFAWLVVRCARAFSCQAEGRWRLGGWERDWERRSRGGEAVRSQQARPLPPTRVETPLEKLQREFAEGALTVEQYEREVGKLYGVQDAELH